MADKVEGLKTLAFEKHFFSCIVFLERELTLHSQTGGRKEHVC